MGIHADGRSHSATLIKIGSDLDSKAFVEAESHRIQRTILSAQSVETHQQVDSAKTLEYIRLGLLSLNISVSTPRTIITDSQSSLKHYVRESFDDVHAA